MQPAVIPTSHPAQACYRCGGLARPWHDVRVDLLRGVDNPFSQTFWCAPCALGFVHPRPPRATVAEFYDLDAYYTHGKSHLVRDSGKTFLDRLRFHLAWRLDRGSPLKPELVHEILGGRPSSICDIGCGTGSLATALAGLGHSVTGVEVDTAAAARSCGGAITLHYGSAEELPPELADRRFDCVVMTHVLEHCIDPARALENVRGLLRPGGVFLCEVPNNDSLGVRMTGPASIMFDAPRHLHFFTGDSLRRACEDAGLAVSEMHFAHYCRQFDSDWIATERHFWSVLHGPTRPSPPKSAWWKLLLRTAFAAPARKYDSVWVRARQG